MKILFLSHESSRTGAPIVLLEFIKWLREHQPQVICDLVSLKSGELSDDFEVAVGYFKNLKIESPEELSLVQHVIKRFQKRLGVYKPKSNNKELLIEELELRGFDVIYANTVLSLDLATQLKKRNSKAKLFCHIHELNTIIKLKVPHFKEYIASVDKWIAVSNLVKKNLVSNYAISPILIETVPEFTNPISLKPDLLRVKTDFLVGGCGTVHWRKGSDLFIQIARIVKHNYPKLPIKFIWVGEIDEEQKVIIDADIQKCELAETLKFVGSTRNPNFYFKQMDLFLLTSREDPFPLVAIEAGKMGKPIIAFDKASGTTEVLTDTSGSVVNYLDIDAMVEQIVFYYKNRGVLEDHGKNAKMIFDQFVPDIICPQLYNVILKASEKKK